MTLQTRKTCTFQGCRISEFCCDSTCQRSMQGKGSALDKLAQAKGQGQTPLQTSGQQLLSVCEANATLKSFKSDVNGIHTHCCCAVAMPARLPCFKLYACSRCISLIEVAVTVAPIVLLQCMRLTHCLISAAVQSLSVSKCCMAYLESSSRSALAVPCSGQKS